MRVVPMQPPALEVELMLARHGAPCCSMPPLGAFRAQQPARACGAAHSAARAGAFRGIQAHLRHDGPAIVLVHQPRAGQLGHKAVAKHLGEAALVVVKPLR